MSDFITIFISFLQNIITVDIFLYLIAAFVLFAIFILIKRIIYR